jgi:histone deacetylase complex regulatory component SIN3
VSSEVPIFEKPLLLVNVEKDNSVKSIDDAYLQLVEHDVAKLISSSKIVSTINLIDKGEIWKNNDSQKRKEFLQNYFNYGNSINLLHLIE